MILAVGLTPAWQKTLLFAELVQGEVNRATEAHAWAAGKPVNVAVALHHLGGSPLLLVPLGGDNGASIRRELVRLGLSCEGVEVASPTRVCTTLVDARRGVVTELVENGGPIAPAELEELMRAYRSSVSGASVVVMTGSIPLGAPKSFYRELVQTSTCPVVLDARGEELLAALDARPFVVKPNRRELEQTLGRKLESEAAVREAMRELGERGAAWVVVSHGPGALLAWGDGQLYRFEPPSVQVVNAIGSGDCLAAGIALALQRGMTMPDAIRFGMGAAAASVTRLEPARLLPEEVERLRKDVRVATQVVVEPIPEVKAGPSGKLEVAAESIAPCRRLCFVGPDIHAEYTLAALRMGEALAGEGKVALVGAVGPTGSRAFGRNQGFAKQLRLHYPQIEVVATVGCAEEEIGASARALTRQIIREHKDLGGIFVNVEAAMAGAAAALEDAGLDGSVCLVACGNQAQNLEFVRDGRVTFALLEPHFAYGYDAMMLLYNKVVGHQAPVPDRVLHLPDLASRDNWPEFWSPETGCCLTGSMKRALVRPVPETPLGPLKFGVLVEGDGVWFPRLLQGAREALQILPPIELVMEGWEVEGWSEQQADNERAQRLLQLASAGCHGVALWMPNSSLVPTINQVVEQGIEVVVFHSEPGGYPELGPEVDDMLGSLFKQVRLRERAEKRLAELSQEDELTGLHNRRRFDRYAADEWRVLLREASDQDLDVSLVMLDIDRLKIVNRQHGHLVGDECLRVVGECIQDSLYRPRDFPARYGGEEFAMILPHTDLQGALGVAERVRGAVERSLVSVHGHTVKVTVSVGVGSVRLGGQDGQESWERLVGLAAQALDRARANGRNRVEVA